MGAGRKTETYTLGEKAQHSQSVNCSTTARNLRKSEIGGVIFGCKHNTIKECFQMELFGLPAAHITYVKNISPGLPLFLFNYSDRKLYGIFEAACSGRLDINPHAWTENSSDYTPYAAQVKFKTRIQCQPLLEVQFGLVIEDNYYQPKLFWFELDQSQTKKLISLFSSSPVTTSNFIPKNTLKQSTPLLNSKQKNNGPKIPASDLNFAKQDQANISRGSCGTGIGIGLSGPSKSSQCDGRSYSSILKSNVHSNDDLKHAQTGQRPLDSHGLTGENGPLDAKDNKESSAQSMKISNLPTVDQLSSTLESQCIEFGLEGERDTRKELIDDSNQCDEQFKCLEEQMEDLYSSVVADPCLPQSVPCEGLYTDNMGWEDRYLETSPSEGNTSEIENNCLHETDLISHFKSPDLQFVVDKMRQEFNKMRLKQFKQEQKMCSLEKELVESRREIKSLKQRLKTNNLVIESKSTVDESILIIGGYNGSSYVSALECFCPSHDLLETLCPISSMRSCTSTVKLNDEVYVIGGLHDNLWCDTVESYNLVENQWATRPSLNQKKGCLSGISFNNKILAIGGGNGVQCFSEVESFDPYVGKWIPTLSMLNKRFTPAAAEINGKIYVVGGFDGDDYLKSVEGFDLRENTWSRLRNMSTKRGCHSVAVLNEKLYAIGGYNGKQMTSSVEIFDPRTGSWIMGESLNISRGYFATVVIGSSIFVIGGLSENNEILDTVECYKEAHGWQSTNLKAVGRRCYLSAVPLSG